MTSQKRFRHHQDGGKNRDRFKDLPPRFKRQKSSSSPTRDLPPSNGEKDVITTQTHEVDSPQIGSALPPPSAAATREPATREPVTREPITREPISSSIYQFKDKAAGHFEPAMAKIQTPHSPSHFLWKHTQRLDNVYVSSPWDYQDYLSGSTHQPAHVALGTHFGFNKSNPPPLYPWAPADPSHFYGPSDVIQDPVWTNSYAVPRINRSSGYIDNNENLFSEQYLRQTKPQDVCWESPSPVYYPASSPPPKNSTSAVLRESSENISNAQETDPSNNKQVVDYSDPDIRTIEMLRELERVADQKERESEDFGADRKSLVSHHLRMLMCAVDRYTEGIEDDLAMIPRYDEVTQASNSRGSTPGVSADSINSTAQEPIADMARNTVEQNSPLQSPRKIEQSVWSETPASSKTSNKLSNNIQELYILPKQPEKSYILQESYLLLDQPQESYVLSNQPQESYVLSNQAQELYAVPNEPRESYVLSPNNLPFMDEQKGAWDLWSSPTFDICNVLTNHNSDMAAIRSMRERRPLYQRQL